MSERSYYGITLLYARVFTKNFLKRPPKNNNNKKPKKTQQKQKQKQNTQTNPNILLSAWRT